jgi:hypothetical protein
MWVPRGRPFFYVVAPDLPRPQITNQTMVAASASERGVTASIRWRSQPPKLFPEEQAIAEPHCEFSKLAAAEFLLAGLIVAQFLQLWS